MTNKTDFSKPYWFYLTSDVHVSYNLEQTKMLLYHTRTGKEFEVNHKNSIQLVKDVYEPDNLGVIKLPEIKANNQELTEFVEKIIKLGMGGIMNIENEKKKPINLLPILNLSNDVEKLKKSNDISLIIPDLISYLSELNIYINGECDLQCSGCYVFYRQVKSCFNSRKDDELHPSQLRKILNQLTYSRVKKINILGGNIFQYTYLCELFEIIKEYQFDFHLWSNYINMPSERSSIFSSNNIFNDVLVTFPVQASSLETSLKRYEDRSKFHFLIENEKQYVDAINLIENLKLNNYSIKPIYTACNIDFFSDNIFLKKEDIFSDIITRRDIFRNQKLNANNFGALSILADGSVNANINSSVLGNIYQNTILELIYRELIDNTAWRVIRDSDVCKNCLYQFLCPSPSNYETVIARPNLCHILP